MDSWGGDDIPLNEDKEVQECCDALVRFWLIQ